MSFEFPILTKPLAIYELIKKDEKIKLTKEQLNELESGYINDEQNEYIYYLTKDQNLRTKWFINEKEFHLMKLMAKLENSIKITDEQLIKSKSNLNKVNFYDVHALQMNQILWIKKGDKSKNLIYSHLKEKIKKDRDLERKLSYLLDNNLKVLITLKDLMQSKTQPNFLDTIIKIEENFIS